MFADNYIPGNMSKEDYEIALSLCENDPEFMELWQEHQDLKEQLKELESRSHLSSEEEMEIKRIKRLKLQGKDRIAQKINQYKVAVATPE
ncbi:MAG: YdcH family protein [bacterium]